MKTFNQETKDHWVGVMQGHQDADRLIQGKWINNSPFDKEMHLPAWLSHLVKNIFKKLPAEEAVLFPVQLLKAIPVDTDIERVRHDLAILRLTDLIKDSHDERVNAAIQLVIDYHESPSEALRVKAARSASESAARSASESPESDAWSAWSAAWKLAGSAARSVTRSATWSAARSAAARSAAWSLSDEWSTARSAAWSTAWSAAWQKERDNLLKLLTD